MTKPTKWSVCPAKTQISLGIRPVWPESSLCAQWEAKDPRFLHAVRKDSDQSGQFPGWSESSPGTYVILLVLAAQIWTYSDVSKWYRQNENVDPDQTAPLGLFAQVCLSKNLESLR